MLPGLFDDRGGGAGLARTDLSGRSESCSIGTGERVAERVGELDDGGIGRDTKDDVGWGVCERDMESPWVDAWEVAETTDVSLILGV